MSDHGVPGPPPREADVGADAAAGAGMAPVVPTLDELGWSRRAEAADPADAHRPARVLRHDGAAVLVGDGDTVAHLPLPGRFPAVAVGDWLLVDRDRPVEVLPRHSLLRRRDPGTGGEQLLASNVDVVGVVGGLDRPVRPGRVERLVTLVWDAGATPVVLLTKADTADPDDVAAAEEVARSSAPGCDVVVLADGRADDLPRLRGLLDGATLVLLGESGAGKSTLVNRLAAGELAGTGAVRAGDHKGRHTTTARQLHLVDGGCVIDTPGLREVGLVAGEDAVDETFAEIAEVADGCRFADCSHDHEPGCAVRAAVEDGELDPDRLASWHALRREVAAAEVRADEHARRRRDRQRELVARDAQAVKRRGRGG